MPNPYLAILLRSLRFGVETGLMVCAAITLVMVSWEWLENPGGVFRDGGDTNWIFLVDTALSWLVPSFLVVAPIAFIGHLVRSVMQHRQSRR